MRQEFIPVATRREAYKACPWAAIVIRVEGGFRAFESLLDVRVWMRQR